MGHSMSDSLDYVSTRGKNINLLDWILQVQTASMPPKIVHLIWTIQYYMYLFTFLYVTPTVHVPCLVE